MGRTIPVELEVTNRLPIGFARLTVADMPPRRVTAAPGSLVCCLPPFTRVGHRYDVTAVASGTACFPGAQVTASDLLGLFSHLRLIPVRHTLRIAPLPQSEGWTGAGRGSSRLHGRHRAVQRGLGSDLHEIRAYQPGDPFRKISWKTTARTARLATREVEAEVAVPMNLLIDASSAMKAGPVGKALLDHVLVAAASLALASMRAQDPCGIGLFTEEKVVYIPAATGKPHLGRLLRQLAGARDLGRRRPDNLPGMLALIQSYLHAIDPLAFPAPDSIRVPEAVLEWLALTCDINPSSMMAMGSPEILGLIERFCHERGIFIPEAMLPPPMGSDCPGPAPMLLDLMGRVMLRGRGRGLIVVFSSFDGIETSPALLESLRLARSRYHTLLLLSPFAPWFNLDQESGSLASAVAELHTTAAMRERRNLRQAALGIGVRMRDLAPQRMVAVVLAEVARLKRDRVVGT